MTNEDTFIEHPKGGHCNLVGMTDDCYGCVYHGTGDTDKCLQRVNDMKDTIARNMMIPRHYLYDNNGNTPINDPKWEQFIKSFQPKWMQRPMRISKGHYLYKGFAVTCIGYYPPEKRVCWEAVDIHGEGFAHSHSMKECIKWIDIILEDEKRIPIKENINQ